MKNTIQLLAEAKKKKIAKKKQRFAFAPFYGRGDGTSGATIPAFRPAIHTTGSQSSHGPSLPGSGGINSPSVPSGANAGMGLVSSKQKTKKNDLKEATHICLVCSNTGKVMNLDCSVCGPKSKWKSKRFSYQTKEQPKDFYSKDPTNFDDMD
jgi:hypothetical protein